MLSTPCIVATMLEVPGVKVDWWHRFFAMRHTQVNSLSQNKIIRKQHPRMDLRWQGITEITEVRRHGAMELSGCCCKAADQPAKLAAAAAAVDMHCGMLLLFDTLQGHGAVYVWHPLLFMSVVWHPLLCMYVA